MTARRRINKMAAADLRYVVRTLNQVRRIANAFDAEVLAEVLAKHVGASVAFPCQFLDDVGQYLPQYLPPPKHCAECGGYLDGGINPARADARYCSPRCRQSAYRKRVTDRTDVSKAPPVTCDGSDPRSGQPICNDFREAAE